MVHVDRGEALLVEVALIVEVGVGQDVLVGLAVAQREAVEDTLRERVLVTVLVYVPLRLGVTDTV